VALCAFDSFCRHAERGHFPDLRDRDNLWRLLVVITARKTAHLRRDECRRKRGGGLVQLSAAAQDSTAPGELEQLLSREPSPEFAAQVAEECERLLSSLGDPQLRSVAVWKMEGWTTDEIAEKLGYTPRSVKRKVRLIRELWEKERQTASQEDLR
jgi:DNA-directed RNA polymerase specialized sigma24 family protein